MLQFFKKSGAGVTLYFFKKSRGFTLIELLVVIAIMGLLAAIIMVMTGPARMEARDVDRKADLKHIHLAMKMCYDDPECGGEARYCRTGGGVNAVDRIGGFDFCNDAGHYLRRLPLDPRNVAPHQYQWIDNSADQTKFCVFTQLEKTGKWVAVSHRGICYTLANFPTALGCWIDCP